MATVRKRTWKTGGRSQTAWVADYFDIENHGGKWSVKAD